MKICIDPGHRNSVYDFGAVSNGVKESVLALDIALLIGKGFEQAGHEVFYTRKSESDIVGLDKRIKEANKINNLDYYLSIHLNSFTSEASNGFEVWHYGGLNTLATTICDNVCKATGLTNRGAKTSTGYAVLKSTYCDAFIIENGFVSNTKNRNSLTQKAFQLTLANAILSAFNVKPISQEEPKPETSSTKTQILLNGSLKDANYILKDGSTYIKLRDLADDKITIGYDAKNKMPIVEVKL